MSSREADALKLAAQIAARKLEHEEPAVWAKAVELQKRGWFFVDFPDGVMETPRDYDRRHFFSARLGRSVAQEGKTMKELVAMCLAWEESYARLKPEFRTAEELPLSHPLATKPLRKKPQPRASVLTDDAEPEAKRPVAGKQTASERREAEILAQREESALEQLHALGFKVSLHEPRTYIEPDVLRGVEGGWTSGVCHATATSTTGKVKSLTGISAVQVLDNARSWLRYIDTHFRPEDRFVIARGEGAAVPVLARTGSENDLRARGGHVATIVSFQDGVAKVVDSHGAPMIDPSRASQFSASAMTNPKERTPDD